MRAPAFVRQFDRISARIFFRAPALQQALFEHAPNDVGERRPVDAGFFHEVRLAQALMLRNGDENSILTRCQVAATHFKLKYVSGALASAMQEVNRRPLEAG